MHFYLIQIRLIQNKLIIAHVLAHCDFFKNNVRFSNTRRDMVESMTATAERIANYEMIWKRRSRAIFRCCIGNSRAY